MCFLYSKQSRAYLLSFVVEDANYQKNNMFSFLFFKKNI